MKYTDIHYRYALAKKLIFALPKCDIFNCNHLATRYEIFSEENSGIDFRTSVYRCDDHKFSNGVEVDELEIAPLIREYLNSVKENEEPYVLTNIKGINEKQQ